MFVLKTRPNMMRSLRYVTAMRLARLATDNFGFTATLRSASARRVEAGLSYHDFGSIVHGDYRPARVEVRGSGRMAAAVAC